MSSARGAGGTRLAPAPPAERRGIQPFPLPELAEQAPLPEAAEPEPTPGFLPLLMTEEPEDDPRVSAEQQAQEMLSSAQAEAGGIRKKAQQDGYQDGYQKGYQAGLEEGMLANRAMVEAACDNLGRALNVLDMARAGILSVMETEMVALVQAAVDRILLEPEAVDPALVRRAVHEAVLRVVEDERLVVRLHPGDLGHVKQFRERLMEDLGGLTRLELRPDPDLRPGDCVVETATAQVDATLETRRQRIFKLLGDSFRQGQRLDMERVLDMAQAGPPQPASAAPASTPASPAPPALGQSELEDW